METCEHSFLSHEDCCTVFAELLHSSQCFFHTSQLPVPRSYGGSVTVTSRSQSVTPLNPVDLPMGRMLIRCSCELARAGEWRCSLSCRSPLCLLLPLPPTTSTRCRKSSVFSWSLLTKLHRLHPYLPLHPREALGR